MTTPRSRAPGLTDSHLHVLDLLPTEQVRPGLEDLDLRPIDEVVQLLLSAEAQVAKVMDAARAELTIATTAVAQALATGGRLIYVGAGTSGRLAALDAAECQPTFGVVPGTIVAVMAGTEDAAGEAFEAAEDDVAAVAARLARLDLCDNDAVVGITASGRTPYVLEALTVARQAGTVTIAVTNNAGSPIADLADHTVELLTGPEVLAGSTRLTAGTAQKIALNVLSTTAMVACGRTYGAWMIGVQASNDKLRRRAARILQDISGVDAARAIDALDAAAGDTPTALVMVLLDTDADTARSRLHAAGGRIRAALDR